jgi:hypothetical protein
MPEGYEFRQHRISATCSRCDLLTRPCERRRRAGGRGIPFLPHHFRNGNAAWLFLRYNYVYLAMTINAKSFLHRQWVGFNPERPVLRKRSRLTLAAEGQTRRRKRGITTRPSRSDRSARAAALPLNRGASLIVALLLSLGLWASIWSAVASLASVVLG